MKCKRCNLEIEYKNIAGLGYAWLAVDGRKVFCQVSKDGKSLEGHEPAEPEAAPAVEPVNTWARRNEYAKKVADNPSCHVCGAVMVRPKGWQCMSCGATTQATEARDDNKCVNGYTSSNANLGETAAQKVEQPGVQAQKIGLTCELLDCKLNFPHSHPLGSNSYWPEAGSTRLEMPPVDEESETSTAGFKALAENINAKLNSKASVEIVWPSEKAIGTITQDVFQDHEAKGFNKAIAECKDSYKRAASVQQEPCAEIQMAKNELMERFAKVFDNVGFSEMAAEIRSEIVTIPVGLQAQQEPLLKRIAEIIAQHPTVTGLQESCVRDYSLIPMAISDLISTLKDTAKRFPAAPRTHHEPLIIEPWVKSAVKFLEARFKEKRCDGDGVSNCIRCAVTALVKWLKSQPAAPRTQGRESVIGMYLSLERYNELIGLENVLSASEHKNVLLLAADIEDELHEIARLVGTDDRSNVINAVKNKLAQAWAQPAPKCPECGSGEHIRFFAQGDVPRIACIKKNCTSTSKVLVTAEDLSNFFTALPEATKNSSEMDEVFAAKKLRPFRDSLHGIAESCASRISRMKVGTINDMTKELEETFGNLFEKYLQAALALPEAQSTPQIPCADQSCKCSAHRIPENENNALPNEGEW
jgi:hypothetical protein